MSNTRYAPEDAPLRQEKFASAQAYNMRLNAGLVAKRCEALGKNDLVGLLWFLQYRSLSLRDGLTGRAGGVDRIAEELLAESIVDAGTITVENWGSSRKGRGGPAIEIKSLTAEQIRAGHVSALTTELFALALDPNWKKSTLPGLRDWRETIDAFRNKCRAVARAKLAETTVSGIVWRALEFTHDTGESSLIIGDPRIGKSETARAFCDAQAGTARYIEVPPSNDLRSLYVVVAEALGVADCTGYKAVEIKERVEAVAKRAKIMLVFDEAQNLWARNMRPRCAPDRVLWINSLINLGVPIAFVALPEFVKWMQVCAKETRWESKQLEQRITLHRRLPESLTKEDFEKLTRHLAPELSPAVVKYIVGCALNQDGAAFVKKVISAASYRAKKASRAIPVFSDIETAIRDDIMPSALTLRDALSNCQPSTSRRQHGETITASTPILPPGRRVMPSPATPAHARRDAPAMPMQAASTI